MAAAEGDTDEDDLARGRGMVVAGRSTSDRDDNAEDVVEPNQQRGAALTGRKRGAPRRPPPRTLAAIIGSAGLSTHLLHDSRLTVSTGAFGLAPKSSGRQ